MTRPVINFVGLGIGVTLILWGAVWCFKKFRRERESMTPFIGGVLLIGVLVVLLVSITLVHLLAPGMLQPLWDGSRLGLPAFVIGLLAVLVALFRRLPRKRATSSGTSSIRDMME